MASVAITSPGRGAEKSCRSRPSSTSRRFGAQRRPSSRTTRLTTFSETTTGRDGSSEAAPRARWGSPGPERRSDHTRLGPQAPPEAPKEARTSGLSAA